MKPTVNRCDPFTSQMNLLYSPMAQLHIMHFNIMFLDVSASHVAVGFRELSKIKHIFNISGICLHYKLPFSTIHHRLKP